MTRITTSKPIRRIRGKDEVTGLGKPKKRGNRPNGSTWPAGPWNGKGMAGICPQ